jgi:hypothetical protein
MNLTFDQLLDLVEKAITIVAIIALYKSVPADKVAELRSKAGIAADRTDTPLDNILLQVYDYVNALFAERQLEQSPAASPAESPYDPSENRD